MFTEAIQHLTSSFPRRFLFNALLPTLVFAGLTAAIAISCVSSLANLSKWWFKLDAISQIATIMGFLAGIWFLSAAVASQWRGIVRIYEGYPLRHLFAKFNADAPGVAWHRKRMHALRKGADADSMRAYYRYVELGDEHKIMPSSLGNILRAAENYPIRRYGIDAIIFWPRLYPLLPERFQRDYEEFMVGYEFPLVVSFEATVATTVSGFFLLITRQPPERFLLVLSAGFAVAFFAYKFSLTAAEEIGEQQRTAFDLYRANILEQWPTVKDVHDERAAFGAITDFVVDDDDPDWEEAQESHASRRHSEASPDQGRV